MNRRDVVEGMLLGAVVGAAVLAPAGAGGSSAESRELRSGHQIIVFDTRFATARQFGADVAPRGWLARGISGDVTPFWHDLLELQWHRHAIAIHGMTTTHSFYCIEQLVADRFWRVTSLVPAGGLVKWTLAPRSTFS